MPWQPLPAEIYALVDQTPATVLLENSKPGASPSPSLLFTNPLRVLTATESSDLPDIFAQIEEATHHGHFAAGFFTYECGHAFEPKVPIRKRNAEHADAQPLAWFGLYDRSYRFDHGTGHFVDGDPERLSLFQSCAETLAGHLPQPLAIEPDLTEQQYSEKIAAIHEWIRAGDVYQLNYTFPLRTRIATPPSDLYVQLRGRQPVEYGAFLHCQSGRHVLCFSPELFFRVDTAGGTRRITTQPMKGTAPRGRTNAEDRRVADWLRNDQKNRSENVMIVDLIRNDLGRLCTFGSVQVDSLFAVERFPTLWQMTSTVSGELRREITFAEIFRALFPCGSITGAPKVRAMQLLAQIEPQPRGIYTGAIGYFSRQRSVFNVAIRTLEFESRPIGGDGANAKMGVGGGIVIDSIATEEFRECQLKAEFLTRREERFSLVETLLWDGVYRLLEYHLDRLQDSAGYFDFACDRDATRTLLLAQVNLFSDQTPHKVRLLADSDGNIHIEHQPLPQLLTSAKQASGRVRIATDRTDPTDRFLYHKTTHRPLYASAFQAAKNAGFDDALFLNTHDQVTEGAISNIFMVKNEQWITPPIRCGLLPGVYRRHLLDTHPGIEERPLHLEDLISADAIYLTNAVRGLRRVALVP